MSGRLALAVGKFDALHRGHRRLAEAARRLGEARLLRLTGLAEAFGWRPRPPLVAETDRARILAGWGIGELAVDIASIRHLDAAGFVAWLRTECGAGALVVGPDFRCGRGRSAGVRELAPLAAAVGLGLVVVPAAELAGRAVSSSRIRRALERGRVALAAAGLGRPHRLMGIVVPGDGRGRTLGFPTANLGMPANLPPAPGVYAAWAELDGRRWPAAVMIGPLPTVGVRELRIEAHLVGYAGDCYGRPLALDCIARLRPPQRFPDLERLRRQIAADVQEAERQCARWARRAHCMRPSGPDDA